MNHLKGLLLSTLLLITGIIYSMEENKNNISYAKSMGNFANIPDEILVKIFDYIFKNENLYPISLEESHRISVSLEKSNQILELKFLNKKFNNIIKNEYKNEIRNIQNFWGLKLIESIQSEHLYISIMIILNKVANLRIKNQSNESAFSEACFHENINILKLLIENGANVNDKIRINEYTGLMHIASSDAKNKKLLIQTIRLLIEAKTDLYVKNREGKTAFDLAKEAKNYEIAILLEDAMKKESQESKEEKKELENLI